MSKPRLTQSARPITVGFVSLGCPKNLVDSEAMLGMLAQAGAVPTADRERADVIVINTCGFLQAAKDESLAAIREAVAGKTRRRNRRVVVAGCLATRMGRDILREVPQVDAVVGAHQRSHIVAAVLGRERAVYLGRHHAHAEPDTARLRLTPRHYAYLRISEGCNRGCSFCTIPQIRGPLRSKPADVVETEARELIADGAVELNIIGQDTTSYGRDLDDAAGLAGLLRRLDRLDGVRWIRLLYAYPLGFTDRVIDAMASAAHVLPYVDLPLQHINDRILKLMKRRVTRRQTEALLHKLRRQIPGITIRTTFITGFPTETDAEHRELLQFVRDFGFDMLGVFSYSQEPSTAAGRMAEQVDPKLRDARRNELMADQQRIVLAANRGLVGMETTALIDQSRTSGLRIARTPRQAPEVDSITFVRPGRSRTPLQTGSIVPVRITDFEGYDLVAVPIAPATRTMP